MLIHILRAFTFFLLGSQALLAHVDDKGCRRCDQRGVIECPKHDDDMLAYEARVEFCSVAAGCEVCAGALLIDCKHCEGGPENHLIGERQKAVAEWMETDAMGAFLERPVPHVETQRFQLVVDTGPLKLGKK